MQFPNSFLGGRNVSLNAPDSDLRPIGAARVSSRTSSSNYKEILGQSSGRSLYVQIPEEAAGRLPSLPPSPLKPPRSAPLGGEKKTTPRTARQAFPDNFESRWLPQRAMISTWMGRLRLQQSELSSSSHSPCPPTLTARGATIARSAIIQASLAKGFSFREPPPPRAKSTFVRDGKEERARGACVRARARAVCVHVCVFPARLWSCADARGELINCGHVARRECVFLVSPT